MSRLPHLLLFDVDGTLLVTKGATSRAVRAACASVLGGAFEWTPLTPGLLDPQLFEQQAAHNGVTDVARHHAAYRACYLAALARELAAHRADVTVLPGVRGLVDELQGRQRDGRVVLGLLSGNYAEGVRLKLDAAGIDRAPFVVSAFGEDAPTRSELLALAIERYETRVGAAADRSRVVVIGDTPRDVECAHAQCCVAFTVATGWYTAAQLAEAGADHVVADFTSPAPLLALLDA